MLLMNVVVRNAQLISVIHVFSRVCTSSLSAFFNSKIAAAMGCLSKCRQFIRFILGLNDDNSFEYQLFIV